MVSITLEKLAFGNLLDTRISSHYLVRINCKRHLAKNHPSIIISLLLQIKCHNSNRARIALDALFQPFEKKQKEACDRPSADQNREIELEKKRGLKKTVC